ncbi:MAG: M28 family peptidase [Pseudomonadota bacterium]
MLTPILRAGAAICLLAAAVVPASAQAVTPIPEARLATAEALIDRALTGDEVGLQFVEDLTTEIGPRLAGSEAERRARDWSSRELSALGFDAVRVEGFDIPFWSRVVERATVVGPNPQTFVVSALGGSAPTPEGGVTAEVVRFESLAELTAAGEDVVGGKIVFLDEPMLRTMDGSGYGAAVRKRRSCAAMTMARGGAGCLIRSVGTQARRFPHTGMMARSGGPMGEGPAAALSPPDADQLTRLLERGPVTLNFEIQVETERGAPSGNVIGELIGSQRPEEVVLIGCHLDSWDMGTGALDDGAGCGIVVGAARLIADLPERPERTIRVVLYGAEEVGLFGGDAYARRHAADLPNHILASESDFGADRIWRFETRFGEGALPHARALQAVLAPLTIIAGNNEARGGPDIGVLRRGGVPVVTPRQNGNDYFDYHHTPDDTFDKIDPYAFRQNVAAYAAFTYLVADSDWDLRSEAPTLGTE